MLTTEASRDKIPLMSNLNNEIQSPLLERFLRYAKIDTTSDLHVEEIPSTACQWDLLKLLEQELKDLGLSDVSLNKNGYLIARLPANLPAGKEAPVIGFMAHVDTSSDMSGKDVKPLLHENYDGGVIPLSGEFKLDPEENPELLKYKGETIITSDGTTLLGSDDKAGVAAIMTAVETWINHPEISHGEIEIIFTPDEETGHGMDLFPRNDLRSVYCYTMDGGDEGEIEGECFNAYKVDVTIHGQVIHLGAARGKLVNAVTMAASYVTMLPQAESPEATDERYGYYCPFEMEASLEKANLVFYLRDFELDEILRRVEVLKTLGATLEALYPGAKVEVTPQKQYLNMREHMDKIPQGLSHLEEAIRRAGGEPKYEIIRGGTDGSRLSEMGIPTPNVFVGGHALHSRYEWAVLSSMVKASATVVHLSELWTK